MSGMLLFQEGEDVMVAREEFPTAFGGPLAIAAVFGVLTVVLWQAGLYADGRRSDAWIVPLIGLAALFAIPFATTLKEARFDRRARVLTVLHRTYWRQEERRYAFDKIVEVRSAYQTSRSWSGYYLGVELASGRTLRLSSGLAEEPVTLDWTRRLRDFLGGRSTGPEPATVKAFTLGR